MKTTLQSILGIKQVDVEAAVAAAVATLQADFDSYKATAEELVAAVTAELHETQAALTAAAEAIDTYQGEAEAMKAEIATLKGDVQDAVVDAEAMRKSARLAKIVEAIGTAQADALMAATEALDDTAFDAVVSALNGKAEAEAKSALFVEQGAAAQADTTQVTSEETAEMKALKAKYAQK